MDNGPGLPDHDSTRRYWRLYGKSEIPGGGTELGVIPFSVEITRIAPKEFTTEITEKDTQRKLKAAHRAASGFLCESLCALRELCGEFFWGNSRDFNTEGNDAQPDPAAR